VRHRAIRSSRLPQLRAPSFGDCFFTSSRWSYCNEWHVLFPVHRVQVRLRWGFLLPRGGPFRRPRRDLQLLPAGHPPVPPSPARGLRIWFVHSIPDSLVAGCEDGGRTGLPTAGSQSPTLMSRTPHASCLVPHAQHAGHVDQGVGLHPLVL